VITPLQPGHQREDVCNLSTVRSQYAAGLT
jgi:hypothetical protein